MQGMHQLPVRHPMARAQNGQLLLPGECILLAALLRSLVVVLVRPHALDPVEVRFHLKQHPR